MHDNSVGLVLIHANEIVNATYARKSLQGLECLVLDNEDLLGLGEFLFLDGDDTTQKRVVGSVGDACEETRVKFCRRAAFYIILKEPSPINAFSEKRRSFNI